MKKLELSKAIKYYEYAIEMYDENKLNIICENIKERLEPDEYEIFLEKSVNDEFKKVSSSVSRLYQHLFKALAQPWEVHSSFYDTIFKDYYYINDRLQNTNVLNKFNSNLNNIIETGYNDAIKEMRKGNDNRGISNLKNSIYNKYDFTKFNDICNEKYLRKFMVDIYNDLYGSNDEYVKRSLGYFDNYFKISNDDIIKQKKDKRKNKK